MSIQGDSLQLIMGLVCLFCDFILA